MNSPTHQALQYFLDIYCHNPTISKIQQDLANRTAIQASEEIEAIIQIYYQAIDLIDNEIWSTEINEALIRQYQLLYQELEDLIASQDNDNRHKFIIVIPVADRPRHLQNCLQSLLTLCQSYCYGGYANQKFSKVAVIIADDSKQQANIAQHKAIANHFNTQGIETSYFGLEEQSHQLEKLTRSERQQLSNILGEVNSVTFHKGPSLMRNITYLKLNELGKDTDNLLFYFVDSDQEFQIKLQSGGRDRELYAINYFYNLDRIFSQHKINILTGKVVGDPPVSPAVMAGTFLDDVIGFLQQMSERDPSASCQFHQQTSAITKDAAYHDMADLFGFKSAIDAYPYQCHIPGEHNHIDCFMNFASKLNQFFHGEHPTRKSYFNHNTNVCDIIPARTIYTGNYIFNSDGLKYFIPFARLKLRMAGPVLGRIIKAEYKGRFVSANLPMLHKRTVEDSGESEFRPGINRTQNIIDLSGEFERQFFGDIMLFTIEKLTSMGYPSKPVTQQVIMEQFETTAQKMRQRYAAKQQEIMQKLDRLKSMVNDENNWWHTSTVVKPAIRQFMVFISNIEHNYDSTARSYELIDSEVNKNNRLDQMLQAILQYPTDRQAWINTLGAQNYQ
jgi:hypothetical protein